MQATFYQGKGGGGGYLTSIKFHGVCLRNDRLIISILMHGLSNVSLILWQITTTHTHSFEIKTKLYTCT